MRLKFLVCGFAILFALMACAGVPDANRDPAKNNRTTFNKDLKECKEDCPETCSGVRVRQWEGCMKLKGWQ